MIPKFRAWDKKSETMDTVRRITWTNSDITDVYLENIGLRRLDQVILKQSTGLKDKNDVEIYEGDIVQMQWTIYDEPELFYIRTIEGRAPRVDNRIKGKELWLVHQDCKVVGNIYQNRELLEVAE